MKYPKAARGTMAPANRNPTHLVPMNLNRVTLASRLTRDPEIKYTPSGTAIADFSLAVTRYYKNNAGESQEDTDFIDVTAFGRSAEIIGKHLKKASPVYVEGRL